MAETHDFTDKYSPDENIFINERDGLTNQHPILPLEMDDDDFEDKKQSPDSDSFDDLPTSLIVTNIHSEVFSNEQQREEMENLFKFFSPNVKFQWFRSFRRIRVNFDSAVAAAGARIQLHQYQYGKSKINCYFAQPVTPVVSNKPHLPIGLFNGYCFKLQDNVRDKNMTFNESFFSFEVSIDLFLHVNLCIVHAHVFILFYLLQAHKFLQPPAPYKQFLISPPPSPPAGWQPHEEGEPIVNHDLLAALANLMPGESHELQPPTTDQPGIVIHTAKVKDENDEDDVDELEPQQARIVHTRCPERT